ncbi:MAG: tetratricopeptide repeat protein [bacterium]|nr:tetratricopeptide repeat protein [bacterium]
MKILLILIMVLLLVGCGGVETVNTGVHIPELDGTKYNDSAYSEGWRLLKSGKPAEAIKKFQESNSIDEKLHVGFGYAFLAQDKLNLARRNFDKALELNPDNLQAHLGIAGMHEDMKETDSAFRVYTRLRAKYPENAWVKVRYDNIKSTETQRCLENAEKFKTEMRIEEYIQALEKAAFYSPEIIEISIKTADFFHEQKDFPKAIFHYEKVLETLPNKEEILVKLAQVYEDGGKFDSAVVIYKRLLSFKPGDIAFINKINELKVKFYDLNLPDRFKDIFFKQEINREDIAALIGHYFEKYLETKPPVIITDIDGSFAREYIIRVCSLEIMGIRPDHSFDRFTVINRASFAVILNALLKYLQVDRNYSLQFTPLEKVVEPADISPLHKNYKTIKFLVNSQLIKLDDANNFNPTLSMSPTEVLSTIKQIINGIN